MNSFTKILAAAGLSMLPNSALAAVVTFEVYAKDHSSNMMNGLATGIYLNEGDGFTVDAEVDDMWFLGGSTTEYTNADGLRDFPQYPQNNLSTLYGTLVGKLGEGDFFEIGTRFVGEAINSGELFLFNWDSSAAQNLDSISVTVSYEEPEPTVAAAVVPVPASGWMLVLALGGIALWQRRT